MLLTRGGAARCTLPCLPVSVEIINTLNNAAHFKALQWGFKNSNTGLTTGLLNVQWLIE